MRPEKESIVNELRGKLQDAVFVILADYRGLSVAKTEDLRQRLHARNVHLQVVKNRMLNLASEDFVTQELTGPSAMVYGEGDVVEIAKILKDFIRENNLPVIKMGALRGAILSAEDIQKLASLPSRDQLLAIAVCTIAAPMTQMAGVLQQKVASLLYALRAIQEKKEAA